MSLDFLYNKSFPVEVIIGLSERETMEIKNMTDKQFDVLMNSIIQIVKDSETKEEAVDKLQNLVRGKDS